MRYLIWREDAFDGIIWFMYACSTNVDLIHEHFCGTCRDLVH